MLVEFLFSTKLLYLLFSVIVGYVAYFYACIALDRARGIDPSHSRPSQMRRVFEGRRPPGPWGLPYIGALLSMEKEFHRSLTRLGAIYGDVFCVPPPSLLPWC